MKFSSACGAASGDGELDMEFRTGMEREWGGKRRFAAFVGAGSEPHE
jgi:hypothetical protein